MGGSGASWMPGPVVGAPPAGAGRHAHLHSGLGLSGGSGYENGWDPAWSAELPATRAGWDSALAGGTWAARRTSPGADRAAINRVTWYAAYAFCIWDDGYLPSEAEWNFAASGGAEHRVFPWSQPPSSTNIQCSSACYGSCCSAGPSPVGERDGGAGRWGQADLGGNVWEWCLDRDDARLVPPLYPSGACDDCVTLGPGTARVFRGGGYDFSVPGLHAARRWSGAPNGTNQYAGVRCARAP